MSDVIPSQPRSGFGPSKFSNRNNFPIPWLIFMKFVANCSATCRLSYNAHTIVCGPIPLMNRFAFMTYMYVQIEKFKYVQKRFLVIIIIIIIMTFILFLLFFTFKSLRDQ